MCMDLPQAVIVILSLIWGQKPQHPIKINYKHDTFIELFFPESVTETRD